MKNVSVIMPAYNAGNFIEESILSIVEQSYEYWTLFIVNDGSKDNTVDVIMKYKELYPNKIKFINKIENEGTVKGLNSLIEAADGDYICWLSADDLYTKNMLSDSVYFLDNNNEFDVVFSNYEYIDENSNYLRTSGYNKSIEEIKKGKTYQPYRFLLTTGCCMHGCTVMLKRQCFDRVGKFDTKYRYAHDYDMWLRIAANYNIGYINEIHVRGREYATQISMQGNNEVDAINVLFDFVNTNNFHKLCTKAGFENFEEAMSNIIIGQLKQYKCKKKEWDELIKVLLEKQSSIIQKFWSLSSSNQLYTDIKWLESNKWTMNESFFYDNTENSYLKVLCSLFDLDAICINKQAIRFDRFNGNTVKRFHDGLMRSNDIVIGTTTIDNLNTFFANVGEEYRSYVKDSNGAEINVGITYYMYMMTNIVQDLKLKNIQITTRDIWWELLEYCSKANN
nr:glycosyltransferase [uncultured Anaerosporobacter sp.]